MKPEKVDYYLNKRKERDAEKRKNDDGRDEGEDLDHVVTIVKNNLILYSHFGVHY